jgi:hypothetical protein
MQIETTQPINFIKYSADFLSNAGAEGVVTACVNGTAVSTVDERFSDAGFNYRTPMLEADLAPGTHLIAFRLDQFGAVPTSAIVSDIATGWGGFVSPGDITVDGVVNVNDLLAVINSWGPCPVPPSECPADVAPSPNGDGNVNVNDLLMVINNWG